MGSGKFQDTSSGPKTSRAKRRTTIISDLPNKRICVFECSGLLSAQSAGHLRRKVRPECCNSNQNSISILAEFRFRRKRFLRPGICWLIPVGVYISLGYCTLRTAKTERHAYTTTFARWYGVAQFRSTSTAFIGGLPLGLYATWFCVGGSLPNWNSGVWGYSEAA